MAEKNASSFLPEPNNAKGTANESSPNTNDEGYQSTFLNIFACLAVLSNGMVIAVMLARRRAFGSFTNRLILHQSIIDFSGGLALFLYTFIDKFTPMIYQSPGSDFKGQLVCRFVFTGSYLLWPNVASTYNLVIISLERFVATCYPIKHRNSWTKSKIKYAVIFSWLIGLAYILFLSVVFEYRNERCLPVKMTKTGLVLVCATIVLIEHLLPVTLMTYAYVRSFMAITKKIDNRENSQPTVFTKAKKNVLVTLLLASIVFVLCWTPMEIDHIDQLAFGGSFSPLVYRVSLGVVSCNTFVNPFIYCFMYRKFRHHLKDLVRLGFRQNRVEDERDASLSQQSTVALPTLT